MLVSFLQQNQSQGQKGTCLKLRGEVREKGRVGSSVEIRSKQYMHM
jgi:hypothetical protein